MPMWKEEEIYFERVFVRHIHFTVGRRKTTIFWRRKTTIVYAWHVHIQPSRYPHQRIHVRWEMLISQSKDPNTLTQAGTWVQTETFLGAYGRQIVLCKTYLPCLLSLLGSLTPYSPRAWGIGRKKQNWLLTSSRNFNWNSVFLPESTFNQTRLSLGKLEYLVVGGQMLKDNIYSHQDQVDQGGLENPILKMKGKS